MMAIKDKSKQVGDLRAMRLYEDAGMAGSAIDAQILTNGSLEIGGYNGETATREFAATIQSEHKDRLLLSLLKDRFGGHALAFFRFEDYLRTKGIPAEFERWP